MSLLDKIKFTDVDSNLADEIPDNIPQEMLDEFEQDPAPGAAKPEKRSIRKRLTPAKTTGNITPALKKRISAEIQAYTELMAIPLVMQDPVCGGVLHEQAKPIADALADILSRYPDIAHKFIATGVIGDWVKLAMALKPVLESVWTHHVTKKNQEDEGGIQSPAYNYPAYRPGQ